MLALPFDSLSAEGVGTLAYLVAIFVGLAAVLVGLPFLASLAFAAGGFLLMLFLAAMIALIALAVNMVRRRREMRKAMKARDPYRDPFGDMPFTGER